MIGAICDGRDDGGRQGLADEPRGRGRRQCRGRGRRGRGRVALRVSCKDTERGAISKLVWKVVSY